MRCQAPLPPLLAGLTSLQQVYVSGNRTVGAASAAQWADLPNLRFLFLNGNDLSGTLPPQWGGMASLEQLVLDGNALSGGIPAAWGGMAALEDLFLRENALSGSIPPELENLGSLEDLYLEGNAFTGCIPAGLRDTAEHDLGTLGLPYCAAGKLGRVWEIGGRPIATPALPSARCPARPASSTMVLYTGERVRCAAGAAQPLPAWLTMAHNGSLIR